MIIGICGLISSGKGTVADILVEEYGYTKISFADKLKDGVAEVFGWDRQMLEGDTDEGRAWREQKDSFWSQETGRNISPRVVLQEFGTDCMRNGFDNNIWVSIVKKKIVENPATNYVIPDVRFENEANMIKSIYGEVWRIRRGPDPVWFRMYQDIGVEPKDIHQSEWAWANVNFNHVIDNGGTIDMLKNQVKDRLASSELPVSV
jgi:hypothetical protein|tara:strand:+ start:8147 stop:8758 length:612 start_codon:yes stop_codon:yes gene_type:complete